MRNRTVGSRGPLSRAKFHAMPRGRHRHSQPLHRLLPPLTVAGSATALALGAWFTPSTGNGVVLRVLVVAVAAVACTGAYLLRTWDRAAGKEVADLRTARARDEWRAEERIAIARDLHDVVSHTLAVVGVHLNVALDAFDTEPDEAKASLRLAQDVRGRAMTDLKALVGVLRDGELPALEGLDRLLDRVRAAGLEVSFNEFGDPVTVPAPVAAALGCATLPKSKGGTHEDTELTCSPCHGMIHATFTNRTLADVYPTMAQLRLAPELQGFIRWVRKQPVTSRNRNKSRRQEV